MHNKWADVDRYFEQHLTPADAALDAALAASDAAGLPTIQVSALQGKLLMLLARAVGARAILEIGTLAGYSTIWMARALPKDGRLVTLEVNEHHAQVAAANIARAGFAQRVEIRTGPALDLLPQLANQAPFDLVFIDADKPNNPHYFDWALKLARKGSLIVVDNVVRGGAVTDSASRDPNVGGVRALMERVAACPRVAATAMQTVGTKGHDGFLIAHVMSDD